VNGQRNVFTTTEDLTGFAFLSSPRHLSPLVSRLRIQPSSNLDTEWDLDYDFTSGRINANTAILTYHVGQLNFAATDAYHFISGTQLTVSNALGRSRYHQVGALAQYGNTYKRGLSGAGAFIFDVQTGVLQVSAFQGTYNWDCCGITAEYARVKIGSIRNENVYRFSYTLTNIGSFGNLLRRERLY
jgi:LPS-assembly protein